LQNNLLRSAKYAARNSLFIAWILKYMSFALPVKYLHETPTLLAFHHPNPVYPLHILLVPKKAIASLIELDPLIDSNFLIDLYATVKILVLNFNLEKVGYRLIVNGGQFQDFPYLHFHLISIEDQKTEQVDLTSH